MASLWNKNNPWAGLSSYPDPEREETTLVFCGRDNESFDVSRLIDNNIFVTLYGRSGTGKTSLLNAGIFPSLRQEHYFPVSIRLGMEGREISFQQSIISRVTGDLQKAGGTVRTTEVVPPGQDEQAPDYLWHFFARSQFVAKEGYVVFPVIVLDQFEEVLHRQTADTETLLRQIHFMMDEGHALPDTVVNGVPYVYDFNFRFVVSIREDDLYRLEDSIDNNYLPEMKSCRYRLRNLSGQGGRDAILIPGGNLLRSDECEKIADTILSLARNRQDNSINANILSLICSRIFVEYQRSGAKEITLDLVEKFIRSNPFEALYHEATAGLSKREKNYIETHLVDSEGRRDSIPESDFYRHVKNGGPLFSGDTKILQRTFVSSDENRCRIELVHDSFCEPLARLKEKRERSKHRKELVFGIAVGLFGVLLGAFLYRQNQELKVMKNFLSEKNNSLTDKLLLSKEKESSPIIGDLLPKDDSSINTVFADGIEYSTASPDNNTIIEWRRKYHSLCAEKITGNTSGFLIPDEMISDHPCLVYLILNSRSLEPDSEKQSWFDLYNLMNEDQIKKLYIILYKEAAKLAEIEGRYQKRQAVMAAQSDVSYDDILFAYDQARLLWLDGDPGNDNGSFEETQDQLLTITVERYGYGEQLENLLLTAISDYEQMPKAYTSRLTSLRNQLGELYLRQNRGADALGVLQKSFALDPDHTSHPYLASAYNSVAYDYARSNNYRKAFEYVEIAIRLRPDNANYLDSKGEFYLMQGKSRKALKMWKKVIKLDPDFLNEYEGHTNLYDGLKEKGLL